MFSPSAVADALPVPRSKPTKSNKSHERHGDAPTPHLPRPKRQPRKPPSSLLPLLIAFHPAAAKHSTICAANYYSLQLITIIDRKINSFWRTHHIIILYNHETFPARCDCGGFHLRPSRSPFHNFKIVTIHIQNTEHINNTPIATTWIFRRGKRTDITARLE